MKKRQLINLSIYSVNMSMYSYKQLILYIRFEFHQPNVVGIKLTEIKKTSNNKKKKSTTYQNVS